MSSASSQGERHKNRSAWEMEKKASVNTITDL